MSFVKPISTPDHVRDRLFRDHALIELYAAVLEYLTPAVELFAHEGAEFLGRAAGGGDAGFLQFVGDDGVGVHPDDLGLNLVDDAARRAGRRYEADPGRDVVERGNAGFDRERPHVRQCRQRAAVELGERAQLPALDQRQAGGGAVDDVVDRTGQEALHRGRAAAEGNVLHLDTGLAVEQIAGEARGDDAGTVVELAGIGLGARDELLDRVRSVVRAHAQQRGVLRSERNGRKI